MNRGSAGISEANRAGLGEAEVEGASHQLGSNFFLRRIFRGEVGDRVAAGRIQTTELGWEICLPSLLPLEGLDAGHGFK